jgi:hypothetical protein
VGLRLICICASDAQTISVTQNSPRASHIFTKKKVRLVRHACHVKSNVPAYRVAGKAKLACAPGLGVALVSSVLRSRERCLERSTMERSRAAQTLLAWRSKTVLLRQLCQVPRSTISLLFTPAYRGSVFPYGRSSLYPLRLGKCPCRGSVVPGASLSTFSCSDGWVPG